MPLKKKENTIMNYEGHLDFEIIGTLIGRLQEIMKAEGERINVYKKILTVMIESLENAYKYCSDLDLRSNGNNVVYFNLYRNAQNYTLKISNPILPEDEPYLTEVIEDINRLDQAGLKELYKKTITNGKFTSKGGAGLGFIEIAKLANGHIDYRFDEHSNKYKYFTLSVDIN